MIPFLNLKISLEYLTDFRLAESLEVQKKVCIIGFVAEW